MLTLQQIKSKTETVFDNSTFTLPEPSIQWKDKIEALEKCGLDSHKASCIFDMRCEQVESIGFQRVTSNEIVEMLMGEPHTSQSDYTADRQDYEWTFDHHTNKVSTPSTWGGRPTDFVREERMGLWYMPPFSKVTKWHARFGKLNYLKRDIPYGVVLKINELKEARIFNAFNVLAPIDAWERKTDIDPIVVGSIWEIKRNGAGQVAHFFVAQW